MITKHVVVAQRQWVDGGEFRSQVYWEVPDGMTLSEVLGLLEFASVMVRKAIVEEV